MDDPYEFRPLPDASCHMRLLTLLGADEASAPVECKMRVVGLGSQQPGEQVPYEALSYTWGADVHDEPVRVDGRPLRVTRNLHHALARLRRHSSQPPRVLWVDAICINQGDDDEKNLQVCEMRHIYGRAAAVVAWLGE
ncbi:heterokaryon incompatibility protein-domain-containing protein, partial [Lasiosphaeria miniovina]